MFDTYVHDVHELFWNQVWVPALSDREDMEGVVQKAFRFGDQRQSGPVTGQDLTQMVSPMLDFAWWFNNTVSVSTGLFCLYISNPLRW